MMRAFWKRQADGIRRLAEVLDAPVDAPVACHRVGFNLLTKMGTPIPHARFEQGDVCVVTDHPTTSGYDICVENIHEPDSTGLPGFYFALVPITIKCLKHLVVKYHGMRNVIDIQHLNEKNFG